MRPCGSPKVLEARRRRVVALLEQDLSLHEIALRLGCHASSVLRWRNAWQAGGLAALTAKPAAGRPTRLTAKQKMRLVQLLRQGPLAHGYRTALWTTQRIAALIERRLGVRYHRNHVGKLLHGLAAVNPAVVQQHDEGAGDLTQQGALEDRDLVALDVVLIQLAVQRAMGALRADGDARDGREAVVRVPVPHDRRLPHRAPRLADRGDQEEARLVDEDEVGPQPCGVCFTRGQTDCFQTAMAASSRSRARRSGFWWLQPIWWRSLPT